MVRSVASQLKVSETDGGEDSGEASHSQAGKSCPLNTAVVRGRSCIRKLPDVLSPF